MGTPFMMPKCVDDYLKYGEAPGNRNETLYKCALQLRDSGFSQDSAIDILRPRAEADHLARPEIYRTIRSAFNGAPRAPAYSQNGGLHHNVMSFTPKPVYRRKSVVPEPLPPAIDNSAIRYLETKFKPGEFVSIGSGYDKNEDGKISILITSGAVRTRETWIADIKSRGVSSVFPGSDGLFVRVNPMTDGNGKADKDVAAYRDVLVEADEGDLEAQLGKVMAIGLPISAIVFSGDRSIHANVTVSAKNEAEYKDRFEILKEFCVGSLGLAVDEKNRNPSRYTRLPGATRIRRDHKTHEKILDDKGNQIIDYQTLLAISIPGKDWTEWERSLAIDDGLPEIKCFDQIIKEAIPKPPEIITGILHKGLKLLLGAPSKAGKTWILIHLAVCIALGHKWLGYQCAKGAVLYINFELPEPFFRERTLWVLEQLGAAQSLPNFFELNLRGFAGGAESIIPKVIEKIAQLPPLLAVVIDPTYKLMGATRDENSAGDMATLFNEFDRLSVQTGASVIAATHFAKGNASVKEAIDRISGSGVFGRDPDSLLIMSPLETDEAYQLDFILRCLPRKENIAIKWNRYLYEVDNELDPDDLRKPKVGPKHKFIEEDLLRVLGSDSLSDKDWREACAAESEMSSATFYRLKKSLISGQRIYFSKTDEMWSKTSREYEKK